MCSCFSSCNYCASQSLSVILFWMMTLFVNNMFSHDLYTSSLELPAFFLISPAKMRLPSKINCIFRTPIIACTRSPTKFHTLINESSIFFEKVRSILIYYFFGLFHWLACSVVYPMLLEKTPIIAPAAPPLHLTSLGNTLRPELSKNSTLLMPMNCWSPQLDNITIWILFPFGS